MADGLEKRGGRKGWERNGWRRAGEKREGGREGGREGERERERKRELYIKQKLPGFHLGKFVWGKEDLKNNIYIHECHRPSHRNGRM